MYAFIEGSVQEKGVNSITILTASGVAYEIYCTQNTLANAPSKGENMRVYTYLSVREDAMDLMGFSCKEEKEMFLLLISVSGIGSKTAIAILGAISFKDLSLAIATEDITALSRAPGVGKKTAQRIALELKDKLGSISFAQSMDDMADIVHSSQKSSAGNEAILALQGLGYTQQEAYSAVKAAVKQLDAEAQADDIVRLALRGMMKG